VVRAPAGCGEDALRRLQQTEKRKATEQEARDIMNAITGEVYYTIYRRTPLTDALGFKFRLPFIDRKRAPMGAVPEEAELVRSVQPIPTATRRDLAAALRADGQQPTENNIQRLYYFMQLSRAEGRTGAPAPQPFSTFP